MPEFLRIATIVVALAVAAWAGYAVARNQPPTRSRLLGLWVIEVFAVVLVVTSIVNAARGHHFASLPTYVAYLVAFLAVPVAGWALARLEPTKWGSVIVCAAGLVEAILVVRLEQVWIGI